MAALAYYTAFFLANGSTRVFCPLGDFFTITSRYKAVRSFSHFEIEAIFLNSR